VLLAGHRGCAGKRQRDAVEPAFIAVGAVLAVAADPHGHQARVRLTQSIGRETHALERARPEVLDEQVGDVA
jgi:hypothetical protein